MLTSFESLPLALCMSLAACAAFNAALVKCAGRLNLLDHPGGRKDHARPVPMVGGIAIFASLLVTGAALGTWQHHSYLAVSLSLAIAIGMWDDAATIAPGIKFAIQIVASAIMIAGAGVMLRSVGDLLGWRPIGLSALAVPVTIFAVVGVVNAFNMIDGLDGLCGSLALVAFAWYAAAAASSGLDSHLAVAVIFCGAIAGFLPYNLRLPSRRHARAFLGDAGSLMLGLALAWLAIDLTQRSGRALTPISALWVLLLPLADCVSLMWRRLERGRDPFSGDREHIHHYLLARGFSAERTMATLVGISAVFGAVGYFGWRLAVPEPLLFWPFFFGFFAYHFWIRAAWKKLESARPSRLRHDSATDQPARMPG